MRSICSARGWHGECILFIPTANKECSCGGLHSFSATSTIHKHTHTRAPTLAPTLAATLSRRLVSAQLVAIRTACYSWARRLALSLPHSHQHLRPLARALAPTLVATLAPAHAPPGLRLPCTGAPVTELPHAAGENSPAFSIEVAAPSAVVPTATAAE
eukprot:scaffold80297_cov30-Tisochrysis_lutea.AAC.1